MLPLHYGGDNAPLVGFEPTTSESESDMLPLHQRGVEVTGVGPA